jgi:hypothetical protein
MRGKPVEGHEGESGSDDEDGEEEGEVRSDAFSLGDDDDHPLSPALR